MPASRSLSAIGMCFLLFLNGTPLWANPTGGVVASGGATIANAGATTTINQSTASAIINWQQFSIAGNEATKFFVPTASSITLNRVLGGNPSAIYGSLSSNGKLILVNPSGIVVGPNGRIDTAGFIGSTLALSDNDFLKNNGTLHFSGDGTGTIDNEGTIHATGGDVYLVAGQVTNGGTISAPQGTAGLAAGTDILFQQAGDQHLYVQATPLTATRAKGVTNTGTIKAAAAELKAAGGNAYALAINNTGQIAATGYKKINGQVYLLADGGDISNSGAIVASNADGSGGAIVVDGGAPAFAGNTVTNSGTLDASAIQAGKNGGTITLKNSSGKVVHSGRLVAKGGRGAKGGSAEVSGYTLQFTGTVDLTAPGGTTGDLLLDPFTIQVVSPATLNVLNGGSGAVSGGENDNSSTIDPATVETALNSASLTLNADTNITITNGITWTTSSTLNLTTNATGSTIDINAPISGLSGTLSIATAGAGDQITTGANGSVQVANFVLNNGYWNQNSATLPVLSASTSFAVNAGTFLRVTGGNGSTGSPYQITDVYGLQGLASPSGNLLNSNAELVNNIDATGTSAWNSGAGFVPIGNSSTPYNAAFNGQGYTINGLAIDDANASYVGLFGAISSAATLAHVGVTNVNVTGVNEVGGLVGYSNAGSIEYAYSTGSVTGTGTEAGGLVGNSSGSLSYSSSSANVTGDTDVGGLAGYAAVEINNSNSTGTVSGTSQVGGLVGENNSTIDTDSSAGAVSGNFEVGGLLGFNGGMVQTAYATGNVTGTGTGSEVVGGLVGDNTNTIQHGYATGSVTGSTTDAFAYGGLVGSNFEATIETSYATGNVTANNEVGGLVGANSVSATVETSYASGAVTAGDSVGGLVGENQGMVETSYATGAVGGGSEEGGLVGFSTGEVETSFATGEVSGGNYLGGLVGTNQGPIQSSYATGEVLGGSISYYIGGLVGYNSTGMVIQTSHATGPVYGNSTVGGLVGENSGGTVETSWASGSVNGTGSDSGTLGGLVGENYQGMVSNSFSTSAVTGSGYLAYGGLVGDNFDATISSSFATGAVSGGTGSEEVGGLVGINGGGTVEGSFATGTVGGLSLLGGLVGYNDSSSTVETSYATGAVTGVGVSSSLGGLVGGNDPTSTIETSYATGAVSGTNTVGGLAGDNYGQIQSSYATGNVTADNTAGGLVGSNSSQISLSFATGTVTGTSDAVGGLVGVNSGTVQTSFATGAVSGGSGADVGGLVGWNDGGTVENTYATGSVSGGASVGGLVGDNSASGVVELSYSTGQASGSSAVGGLLGQNDSGTVASSYWAQDGSLNSSLTGVGQDDDNGPDNVGATPESLNSLTQQSTFAPSGWDFGLTWTTYGNATAPLLQALSVQLSGTTPGSSDNMELISNGVILNTNPAVSGAYTYVLPDNLLAQGILITDLNTPADVFYIMGQIPSAPITGVNLTTGVLAVMGTGMASNTAMGLAAGTLNQNATGILYSVDGSQNLTMESTGDLSIQTRYQLDGNVTVQNGGLITSDLMVSSAAANVLTAQSMTLGGQLASGGELEFSSAGTITDIKPLAASSFVLENGTWEQIVGQNGVGSLPSFYTTHDFELQNSSTFERFAGGSNTLLSPYQITDVYGLEGLASPSGSLAGVNAALTQDIDATGTATWNGGAGWVPIGGANGFTGNFNGNGYLVGGLTINATASSNIDQGLFGTVAQNGSIIDVGLGDMNIQGYEDVGGIAGANYGSIQGAFVIGSISAQNYLGGLVGYNESNAQLFNSSSTATVTGAESYIGGVAGQNDGTITNDFATGSVTGSSSVGGLVGANAGTLSDSYAMGEVQADGDYIGGLAGGDVSSIINSYATGIVDAPNADYVGGLVGYASEGSIQSSHATGAVTGYALTGGLVGESDATVETSYATGSVAGASAGYSLGGLAGENRGTVLTSYATGAVSGGDSIGGLVGSNEDTVQTSYATGQVTGSEYVGGLVGHNDGTVQTSYATGEVIGSAGGAAVGGLVGGNFATVSTSFATGSVAAGNSEWVGGLVGDAGNGSVVEASYSIGSVGGFEDVGGLVGINFGTVETSYWAQDTNLNASLSGIGHDNSSGTSDNVGATPETLASMMQQSTFTPAGAGAPSWDFTNTWTTNGDTNTPQLIGLPATTPPPGVTPPSNPTTYDLLSGTAYSDNGTMESDGVTIELVYDGTVLGTTPTNGSGIFSFNVTPSDLTSGVLLIDATDNGNTFYQANSPASTISGIDIWGSTLRVVADVASNGALGTAAGGASGINFSVSSGSLTTNSGVNMVIASNYAQNGVVGAYTLDGNITAQGSLAQNAATNFIGSSPVTIQGTSVVLAGTFNRSGALDVTSTSGSIELDGVGTFSGPAAAPGITLDAAGALSINNSYLESEGQTFTADGTGSVTSEGYAPSTVNGILFSNSTIDAQGGDIHMTGYGGYNDDGEGDVTSGSGIYIGGGESFADLIQTSGTGNITLTATVNQNIASTNGFTAFNLYGGGTGNSAVISVASGLLSITGKVLAGSTDVGNDYVGITGVDIVQGAVVKATLAGGSVTLDGDVSATTLNASAAYQGQSSVGVEIDGSGSTGTAVSIVGANAGSGGVLTITGTGGTIDATNSTLSGNNTPFSSGFSIDEGAAVSTGTNATVTITGTGGAIATTGDYTGGSAGVSFDGSTLTMGTGGTLGVTGHGGAVNAGYGANAADASSEGVNLDGASGDALVSVATGGSITLLGYGGALDNSNAEVTTGHSNPDTEGVSLSSHVSLEASGTTTISMTGTGGDITPGSNPNGNAVGVNIGSGDGSGAGDALVSSGSGAITITGYAGSTPSLGMGAEVHGFNGKTATVETTGGNISITGTGGANYAGDNTVSGNLAPNYGVALIDAATLQTTGSGTITLVGTGNGRATGVAVQEISDTTLDSEAVLPQIEAGGALTIKALSGTGELVNATVTAASAVFGAETTPGNAATITSGNLDILDSSITLAGGAFTAYGAGYTSSLNGNRSADGIDVLDSTINAQGGAVTLAGTGGYTSDGVNDYAGIGVSIQNDSSGTTTVETSGSANVTVTGTDNNNVASINGAYGVFIYGTGASSTKLSVASGLLSVTGKVLAGSADGTGLDGANLTGLEIGNGAQLVATTGTGGITLVGDVSGASSAVSGTNFSFVSGIEVGSNTQVNVQSGIISITGTGASVDASGYSGLNGVFSEGIIVDSGAQVTGLANAQIVLDGEQSSTATAVDADLAGALIDGGSTLSVGAGGTMSLTGNTVGTVVTASATGNNNVGLQIDTDGSATHVQVGASGQLTLIGHSGNVNASSDPSDNQAGTSGVYIDGGSLVTAGLGTGVTITGTAGNATTTTANVGQSAGVGIEDSTLTLSGSNTTSITGTGGSVQDGTNVATSSGNTANSDGVHIGVGAVVNEGTGGTLTIHGYGGGLTTTNATATFGSSGFPQTEGLGIFGEILAAGNAAMNLYGTGGNVTSGTSVLGGSFGVNIGNDNSDVTISAQTGEILINGTGGTSPNLGMGVALHGFNGYVATVETTTGTISITGVGGPGNTGPGSFTGLYEPNYGVGILNHVAIKTTTGGPISITGSYPSGDVADNGVAVLEITGYPTLDSAPVKPDINAGTGSITVNSLSSDGIVLNGTTIEGHDLTLGAATNSGDPSTVTSGQLELENSTVTLTTGNLTAYGLSNSAGPDGIILDHADVELGGGNISLAGQSAYFASTQDAGVAITTDTSTLRTTGSGGITLLGVNGSGNNTTLMDLQGIDLYATTVSTGSGQIMMTGTVKNGAARTGISGLLIEQSTVEATGNGSIVLNGDTRGSTGLDTYNDGVRLYPSDSITTLNGAGISITGHAGAGQYDSSLAGSSGLAGVAYVDGGTMSTTGTAPITVTGYGGAVTDTGATQTIQSVGVAFLDDSNSTASETLSTVGGTLSISGTGGTTDNSGFGVDLAAFASHPLIIESGTGNIIVTGTAGSLGGGTPPSSSTYFEPNIGVVLADAVHLQTTSGALTITGTGRTGQADSNPNESGIAMEIEAFPSYQNGGPADTSFTSPQLSAGQTISLTSLGGAVYMQESQPGSVISGSVLVTSSDTSDRSMVNNLTGTVTVAGGGDFLVDGVGSLTVKTGTGNADDVQVFDLSGIALGSLTANSLQLEADNGGVSQSGAILVGTLGISASTSVSLLNPGNNISNLAAITSTGPISIYTDPGLTVQGVVQGNGALLLESIGGGLILGANSSVTNTGAGNVTLVTDQNFVNNSSAGASAVQADNGYFQIYAGDPSSSNLGGLPVSFSQYNTSYSGNSGATGNGVYFAGSNPNAGGTTPPPDSGTPPYNSGGGDLPPTVGAPVQTQPSSPPPTTTTDSQPQPTSTFGTGSYSSTQTQSGGLASSTGSSGDVGSGDAAQLNNGEMNNVSNPHASGALNDALSSAVHETLQSALGSLGDSIDTSSAEDSTTDTSTGGNGQLVGDGGVVEIGDGSVKTIPLSSAPQPLQDALGSGVMQGLQPAGH